MEEKRQIHYYKDANEIWPILNNPEYSFLKDLDKKNRMLFVTLSGSRGYGTCLDFNTADYDFRGVMGHTKSGLLGFGDDEQFVVLDKENDVDATIYTLKKLVELLIKCNPNTIELLGMNDYLIYSPVAISLLAHRHLFLSRAAISSFGGYATAQFDRLENNLARFTLPQSKKEEHILHSVLSAMESFPSRYSDMGGQNMKLYVDKSDKSELDTEIFTDLNFSHYPLRDFAGILQELNSILRNYNKVNHRNRKKDNEHLNKHAMHLIRLYFTLYDILTKEEIISYRENERELLLSIRRGEFQKEDGTYRDEFFQMLDDLKMKCKDAERNTGLPEKPDMKEIEELLIFMNETLLSHKK